MKKTTVHLLSAAITLSLSSAATAAAFQLLEQNASGLGVAYAGSAAVAENASTVFFNPAGLAQLSGIQLSAGVTGVGPSYRFQNQGSSGPLLGNGNGGDAGGWHAVPNLYLAGRVSPDISLGLGISSPFGLATSYDADWVGRTQAIKSEIRTVNVNPSLAYRVNERWSLGVGINYQTLNAEMTSYTPAGLYRVKGDDAAWGWNAGVLLNLSPAMRLGLSYRSAVDYRLSGSRSIGANSQAATADIKLPDSMVFSVWQQLSDRWEAMGDLSYTRWSTLDKLQIVGGFGTDVEPFNYKNAWRVAWGAAYKANDAVKLKFGLAYDRTPVQENSRSARVPDNDRMWFSLGGQWAPRNYGVFDIGYSYLYVRNPGIEQSKLGTSLRGDYDAGAHLLGVQYSVGF